MIFMQISRKNFPFYILDYLEKSEMFITSEMEAILFSSFILTKTSSLYIYGYVFSALKPDLMLFLFISTIEI